MQAPQDPPIARRRQGFRIQAIRTHDRMSPGNTAGSSLLGSSPPGSRDVHYIRLLAPTKILALTWAGF